MKKPTLEEMADACQLEADRVHGFLKHYEEYFPTMRPDQVRYRQMEVWESAAQLLRILGTYSDDSRVFVAGLLKRHQAGK